MEFSEFIDRVNTGHADTFQGLWMPDYPDPDSVLRASPIRPRTHWQNEEYDGLVDKARRILDQEERLKLYGQADRIMVEEQAVIVPLSYIKSHVLVKPWVRQFPASEPNQWLWKNIIVDKN
jgi:oligopeptide transport system substrate-binding protein